MSAERFFLDTNILVYTFDRHATAKRAIAVALVEDALNGGGCISYQVVQEFLNLATRRFTPPFAADVANQYVSKVLLPLCTVHSSAELYDQALGLHYRLRYSLYDSLIIAAAQRADCTILYSEDLQHGQGVDRLTITNPFLA